MKQILLLLFILFSQSVFSQESFSLAHQHNGNYDFTMIGATFNSKPNNGNNAGCDLNLPNGTTATATLNLTNNQPIIAAYLYWSSNLSRPDSSVELNGQTILSDKTRTEAFSGLSFFYGVKDITSVVQSIGNGEYTLTGLELNRNASSNSGCSTSYGGWSILVVYEDLSLPKNSVNIYEGFRGVQTNGGRQAVQIDFTDLLVANTSGSKLGILAWEGDASVGPPNREQLTINGNVLGNPLNPATNLFNETNSFTGNTNFYNMDMDFFDISAFVSQGDESATIIAESQQDLVLINVIAFTLNSELPDATLKINDINSIECDEKDITVNFDVNNFNSNDILPAGTSVKFYINEVSTTPLTEIFTSVDLPIGDTENITTTFQLPDGINGTVKLVATVNLDENEKKILLELNSNNNKIEIDYTVPSSYNIDDEATICANEIFTLVNGEDVNTAGLYTRTVEAKNGCDSTVNLTLNVNPLPLANNASLINCSEGTQASYVLSDANSTITSDNNVTISYYLSKAEAESQANELPNNYTSEPKIIIARVDNSNTCSGYAEVSLEQYKTPETTNLSNESLCVDVIGDSVIFDLNQKDLEIVGNQNANEITYLFYTSENNAENKINEIQNPTNYEINSDTQQIWVRVENSASEACFITNSFTITKETKPNAGNAEINIANCGAGNQANFDLTNVEDQINTTPTNNVVYFRNLVDAENQENSIADPTNYSASSGIAYATVINPTTGCFGIGEIQLTVLNQPQQNNQELTVCAINQENLEGSFNLQVLEDAIIGDVSNIVVTFHPTQAEARNGINSIQNSTNYISQSGTVFARSSTSFNGTTCATISEIKLIANTNPEANEITYKKCADEFMINNFDMRTSFDLQSQNVLITGGQANRSIQYFPTLNDAENNIVANELENNYFTNSVIVYARVTNTVTNCTRVTPLNLEVLRVPGVELGLTIDACQIEGIATFDLANFTSELKNSYPGIEFEFYESEADLESQQNQISQTDYISVDKNIYLRSEFFGEECSSTSSVKLNVLPIPTNDRGTEIICVSNGFTLPNGEIVFETGIYERLIQNPNTGCDILTITNLIAGDIMFPNTFSPNNNGANDVFKPIPNEDCVGDVEDYELKIFNRWGEVVFKTNDFTEGWNGKFETNKTQTGIYLYTAIYKFDGVETKQSGSVKLIK